jgi:hypothetical protein
MQPPDPNDQQSQEDRDRAYRVHTGKSRSSKGSIHKHRLNDMNKAKITQRVNNWIQKAGFGATVECKPNLSPNEFARLKGPSTPTWEELDKQFGKDSDLTCCKLVSAMLEKLNKCPILPIGDQANLNINP